MNSQNNNNTNNKNNNNINNNDSNNNIINTNNINIFQIRKILNMIIIAEKNLYGRLFVRIINKICFSEINNNL
jgi:hypothetical protein